MENAENTAACVVYVTAPDRDVAAGIARELVAQRLIACANIWDGVVSVYRWEGEVEEGSEAVLWMKTRAELVDEVMKHVLALHPYECPCVVSWPISSGAVAYLDWIDQQTERGEGQA